MVLVVIRGLSHNTHIHLMPAQGYPDDDPQDPSFQVLSQHYTILDEVGRLVLVSFYYNFIYRGGWGVVKRAIHIKTKQHVALKQIPRKALSSKALDREILTLRASSNHASIIQLLEVVFTAKVLVLSK